MPVQSEAALGNGIIATLQKMNYDYVHIEEENNPTTYNLARMNMLLHGIFELGNSYSDMLTYHIVRRDGNYQLPRDMQFVESIKTCDAYHMLKPFQIFLFEQLEISGHGEYNDVATDVA